MLKNNIWLDHSSDLLSLTTIETKVGKLRKFKLGDFECLVPYDFYILYSNNRVGDSNYLKVDNVIFFDRLPDEYILEDFNSKTIKFTIQFINKSSKIFPKDFANDCPVSLITSLTRDYDDIIFANCSRIRISFKNKRNIQHDFSYAEEDNDGFISSGYGDLFYREI